MLSARSVQLGDVDGREPVTPTEWGVAQPSGRRCPASPHDATANNSHPGRGRIAVSVVTVTNRPGSIDIIWQTLACQTFQDFEWILCDELYRWRHREVAAYVRDGRLRHVPAPVVAGDL